jgi:membrane-associated protein
MPLLDYILHMEEHLTDLTVWLGPWFYGLLFAIIFSETGLVVAPFLPGDSLLFAVGALASNPDNHLRIEWLVPLLIIAAVLGDAVNYAIGKFLGPKVFRMETGWLLNKRHLERAEAFYVRHGGKAIFLARFLPILRTFAPFVAGIGRMEYRRFWMYNVAGGVVWVASFLMAGYWFGGMEWVKDRFHLIIVAIIGISVLPIVYEWYRARRQHASATARG